jgi:hypothetical protein
VGGVGLKTAAKRFPMLEDGNKHTVDEIIQHSKKMLLGTKKRIKAYQNVIDNSDILRRNYKMMQLYIPSLGLKSKQYINVVLNDIEYDFNKTKLTKMMIMDGFGELNLIMLFAAMNKIVIDQNLRK